MHASAIPATNLNLVAAHNHSSLPLTSGYLTHPHPPLDFLSPPPTFLHMRTCFAPAAYRFSPSTFLRQFVCPSNHCLRSRYSTAAAIRARGGATEFLLPNQYGLPNQHGLRPSLAVATGVVAATHARRHASGGGFMRMLFKRAKKAPRRDDTTSSRYLDATPEDSVMSRSLLQKSNDDYLRCTEFDCEGVA